MTTCDVLLNFSSESAHSSVILEICCQIKLTVEALPFDILSWSANTSLLLFSLTYLNIVSQQCWNRDQCYLHLGNVPQVPSESNPQINISRQVAQAICHIELNSFQTRTLDTESTKLKNIEWYLSVCILQFLNVLNVQTSCKLLTVKSKTWWEYAQDGAEDSP